MPSPSQTNDLYRNGTPDVEAAPLRHSRYPSVAGEAMVLAARLQTWRWDRVLKDVERAQESTLRDIVGHAQRTFFGKQHDFAGVRSYRDFVLRVPVGDYDSHAPFLERMRAGERGLLVPEFVTYYGNSSGSSNQGKAKFLPITDTQISHQRMGGSDALMRYLDRSRDADFVRGFTLGLFPPTTMRREGDVLITSNPALMVTKMPRFTAPMFLPNEEHRTMADYEKKLRVVAESYLDHDVRALTGTTCWFSLFFEQVLAAAGRRGRPARRVADIWPNLRLLIGGGVSAPPYLPVIRDLYGRDLTLVDTYSATEGGFFASSDFSGERGMLMMPHRGTFYELVPVEEHAAPTPTRVPLWAVEKDRPYAILVTTTSGLYSYKLGDIVRFPSTSPLRIEFVGRLSGCLSITQELTTHVEIERAVAFAVATCPCVTRDFGAGAEIAADGAKSRYVLFAEFQERPTDLAAFAAAFDEELCRQNRVYREHRNVAILAPIVLPLVQGGAHRFLAEVTRGNMQGKFPRIVDENRVKTLYTHVAKQDA